MFKEKYEKDLVNHYEIVSKKNKDNDWYFIGIIICG
jgi:hypothetical protein